MKFKQRTKTKIKKVARNCPFCSGEKSIIFSDVALLKNYVTDRGKILSHDRTGICSKHQRGLARSIKHARHLALLPFVAR